MPAPKPPEFRRRATELARLQEAHRPDHEGPADRRVVPAELEPRANIDEGTGGQRRNLEWMSATWFQPNLPDAAFTSTIHLDGHSRSTPATSPTPASA